VIRPQTSGHPEPRLPRSSQSALDIPAGARAASNDAMASRNVRSLVGEALDSPGPVLLVAISDTRDLQA
jgi:hypothetical protein